MSRRNTSEVTHERITFMKRNVVEQHVPTWNRLVVTQVLLHSSSQSWIRTSPPFLCVFCLQPCFRLCGVSLCPFIFFLINILLDLWNSKKTTVRLCFVVSHSGARRAQGVRVCWIVSICHVKTQSWENQRRRSFRKVKKWDQGVLCFIFNGQGGSVYGNILWPITCPVSFTTAAPDQPGDASEANLR